MRPAFLLLVAGVAMAIGVSAGAQPPAAPALPKLITTRQNAFAIPFRLEGVTGNKASAEVQLHVSENRGINWQIASRVPPSAGKFSFRAPRDGEYWFMVRTVDDRGVVRPSGPAAPELRVLVDTAHPQLDLIVTRGEAGEMRARWRVSDANLPPDGLKLSYRATSASDQSWQPVAVDPIQGGRPEAPATGEATWWPEHVSEGITVRAEVTDTAGNTTSSQGQVDPSSQPPAAKAAEGIRTPEPIVTAPPPTTPPPAEVAPTPTASNVPPVAPAKPKATAWPANSTPDVVTAEPQRPLGQPPRMASRFPAMTTQTQPLTATKALPTSGQPAPIAPRYADQASTPASPPTGAQESRPPAMQLPEPSNPTALARANESLPPSTTSPPVTPPSRAEEDQEAAAFQGQVLPPGVRPRMVNRRRFELEYDIESIGPEGIGKIELWGTRDGGQTWLSFGTDPDNRSPFVVGVENEGLYGFRIVVETSTGVRGTPPRSGELPEIWVGVDTASPVAKLLPADAESAARTGEISIRWQAADQLLAARPISLAYAQSASGPWTVLASGLENSGHYDWRPDNRVPDRLFLRLEVRDEAGNIQTIDSVEPLTIVRTRPQGRILGVRPIGDSARKSTPNQNL